MASWVLRDDRFLRHDAGPGHPENAARVLSAYRDLDARPVPGVSEVDPVPVSAAAVARVHGPELVRRLEATRGVERSQLDVDTIACADSYEAAVYAAGAVVQATDAVCAGDADGAFALVRPPGHHAEADRAMGFCLLNNVAIAAAHAVAELGCERVLVIDPDVHHGNGTQHAFWRRADVTYVSSHRYPFYPGTGWYTEIGEGEGAGHTVNLPLDPGMGDADLLHLYRAVVAPIVDEWRPDLILVSAGFDTWCRDPLGGCSVTDDGFTALFGDFLRWADACCPGRLALALEGGYDPEGVRVGVRAALELLTRARDSGRVMLEAPSPRAVETAEAVRRTLAPHWSSLRG